MTASILYSAKPNDQVAAKAGEYFVIVRVEDQSGIALLGKLNPKGEKEIIAQSEDIVPEIAKLVPQKEAMELATQLVKDEIEKKGGVEKTQASIDATAKKYGANFFSYLTPLSVAAYKTNGVVIPRGE